MRNNFGLLVKKFVFYVSHAIHSYLYTHIDHGISSVTICVLIDDGIVQKNSILLNIWGGKCLTLKRPLSYRNRSEFIACLPEWYWMSWAGSHQSIVDFILILTLILFWYLHKATISFCKTENNFYIPLCMLCIHWYTCYDRN